MQPFPSLPQVLARLDGVATRRDLVSAGFTPKQLTLMLHLGVLLRARINHYVDPLLHPDQIEAIRIGGRLASVSAAHSLGLWVPDTQDLHVSVRHNDSRFRDPRPSEHVIFHWDATELAPRPRNCVAILDALMQIIATESTETAVCVVDSALNRRLVTPAQVAGLAGRVPERCLPVFRLFDGAAESGIESIARVRLAAAGIRMRSQVVIADGIRVDFLVGDSLIIEVDGAETHTGREHFERDRSRDAYLNSSGHQVLHFSYRQVMNDWATVESTVLIAARRAADEARNRRTLWGVSG